MIYKSIPITEQMNQDINLHRDRIGATSSGEAVRDLLRIALKIYQNKHDSQPNSNRFLSRVQEKKLHSHVQVKDKGSRNTVF